MIALVVVTPTSGTMRPRLPLVNERWAQNSDRNPDFNSHSSVKILHGFQGGLYEPPLSTGVIFMVKFGQRRK